MCHILGISIKNETEHFMYLLYANPFFGYILQISIGENKTMKINFTKKEYRLLLDMLDISDWVMSAFEAEKSEKNEAYGAIQQKIFSYAKTMSCEDIIKYDERLGGYYPTWEYEESEHREYIKNYDEDIFWEELPHRLAARDLILKMGEKQYGEMDAEKRFMEISERETEYAEEFEKNGIKNLKIKKTDLTLID